MFSFIVHNYYSLEKSVKYEVRGKRFWYSYCSEVFLSLEEMEMEGPGSQKSVKKCFFEDFAPEEIDLCLNKN